MHHGGLNGVVLDDPYDRNISLTPGRSYNSDVKDWGASLEAVYDFGGAELTSISAYRYNEYERGQDADFNNLDILYRDGSGDASTTSRPSPRSFASRASLGRPARLAGRRLLRQRESEGQGQFVLRR